MTDPIYELIQCLHRGERPPLAWLVRWSPDGRDPVHAAWAVSRDGWAMRMVLREVDHPALGDPEGEYPDAILCGADCRFESCQDCVAALRRVVPVPPTLAALLARGGRP